MSRARGFTATQRACLQALELPVWQRRDAASTALDATEAVIPPESVAPLAAGILSAPYVDPRGLDWSLLQQAVLRCAACDLQQMRTQAVFGVGVRQPELVIVGEAPGAEEEQAGEPFVGPAGQLLDRMLAAIDCARTTNVFITNALKCRPPNQRDPHADEAAACRGWLLRQMELLQPKVILCMGQVAAQALLQTTQSLSQLRGSARLLVLTPTLQVPVFVTYHPAHLLRTPADKAQAWADLKQVRAALAAA